MTGTVLKWFGAALIVFSGAAMGLGGAMELRRRVQVLSDLMASLLTMRGEVAVRMTPIPELMEDLARTAPPSVRPFYGRVVGGLPLLGTRSFAEIWRRAAEDSEEMGLKAEELNALLSLGTSLGRYDAPEQEKAIDLCISRLGSCYSLAREESRSTGRLVMGLGIAGGLVLAVILI